MTRKLLRSVVLIVCGVALVSGASLAAGKKKTADKADPALPVVERVLRSEADGPSADGRSANRPVDRREQLATALEQNPDSEAARWQSGFIRAGNQWRSFDEP
ncbi:MAG TPA: hypothetical protein VGH74_16070, partial [Planctomycetaceae bacterium]